jgi:hypothetical protein
MASLISSRPKPSRESASRRVVRQSVFLEIGADGLHVAGLFEVIVLWARAHEYSARQLGECPEIWELPVFCGAAGALGGFCGTAGHGAFVLFGAAGNSGAMSTNIDDIILCQ